MMHLEINAIHKGSTNALLDNLGSSTAVGQSDEQYHISKE